jgi:hypothetical protein
MVPALAAGTSTPARYGAVPPVYPGVAAMPRSIANGQVASRPISAG